MATLGAEKPPHVVRRSAVLLGDAVGVVAGHLHDRPTDPNLLLCWALMEPAVGIEPTT
jgi:hypothetical protein